MKIVFIAIISFVLMGCPDQDDFEPDLAITFQNNSDSDLLVFFDFNNFPDTSIIQGNPFSNQSQLDLALVQSNESKVEENEFIKILENSNVPLMIFLFPKDTVDQVPWERIRNEYLVYTEI